MSSTATDSASLSLPASHEMAILFYKGVISTHTTLYPPSLSLVLSLLLSIGLQAHFTFPTGPERLSLYRPPGPFYFSYWSSASFSL